MGQCVLRDLGFEFEKDPEKRKMLDDFLKEKLRTKYPQAQGPPRSEEDDDIYRMAESTTRNRDKSPRYTRAGGSSRPTTQIEKCIQTDMDSEDSLRKSKTISYENTSRPGSKITTQQSFKFDTTPKYDSQAENGFKLNGLRTPTGHEIKNIPSTSRDNSTPTQKQKSEMNLADMRGQSKRSIYGNQKENMFDGIENIDFTSPSSKNLQPTSTRSRNFRGFENKYFRPTRGRSPSPMTEDANIFDDDDDDGIHDDD